MAFLEPAQEQPHVRQAEPVLIRFSTQCVRSHLLLQALGAKPLQPVPRQAPR